MKIHETASSAMFCSGQGFKKKVHYIDSLNVLRSVVREAVEEQQKSRKFVNLSYISLQYLFHTCSICWELYLSHINPVQLYFIALKVCVNPGLKDIFILKGTVSPD
jgi:hypothetical protein